MYFKLNLSHPSLCKLRSFGQPPELGSVSIIVSPLVKNQESFLKIVSFLHYNDPACFTSFTRFFCMVVWATWWFSLVNPIYLYKFSKINSLSFTALKKEFYFANVLKRWSFQIKLRWNMIFLALSGKVIFLFPENMIWSSLDGKWKMIFLKKIHGNMIFSASVLKRSSFQKTRTGIWSFLNYQERLYFNFRETLSHSLSPYFELIY